MCNTKYLTVSSQFKTLTPMQVYIIVFSYICGFIMIYAQLKLVNCMFLTHKILFNIN